MKNKPMSDHDVSEMAFKKLTGDLDHIEADGMFNEDEQPQPNEGTKVEAHGVSVHIKPMNGEQTKDTPEVKDEPKEKSELGELGL